MSLVRIVQIRDGVDELCRRMDSGELRPTEEELALVAHMVADEAGPLAHDLLCKLASRSKHGREALKQAAQ